MPTYIALINLTDQGIRNVKAAPQLVDRIRAAFEAVGGSVPDVYLVMGPYDAVAICEAPDDETYTRLVLSLAAGGDFRTTTLKAIANPRALLATLP